MDKAILSVGRDFKYGGFDFAVSAAITDVTEKEIDAFRAMCVVALRVADNMWMKERENNEKRGKGNNEN